MGFELDMDVSYLYLKVIDYLHGYFLGIALLLIFFSLVLLVLGHQLFYVALGILLHRFHFVLRVVL